MAPPSKKEPTLWDILSLAPTTLEGQDSSTQTKTVRQAYRRALLKHHPDKNQQAKARDAPADPSDTSGPTSSSGKDKAGTPHGFTVDQITEAYTVLSDSRRRREYTRSLHTSSSSSSSSSSTARTTQQHTSTSSSATATWTSGGSGGSGAAPPRQSGGVETVDLDDLEWDGKRQVYYRGCGRCGAARGYCFRELDLEEVGGEDGELMVQCTGCSLWLRVLFDEVEDEEDRGGDSGGAKAQEVQHQRSASTSGEGKSGGWSWKFNLGISLGGSASASASAGKS